MGFLLVKTMGFSTQHQAPAGGFTSGVASAWEVSVLVLRMHHLKNPPYIMYIYIYYIYVMYKNMMYIYNVYTTYI